MSKTWMEMVPGGVWITQVETREQVWGQEGFFWITERQGKMS